MKEPTENQVRLMRQILQGEEDYGPQGFGVFSPGGAIPGLLKRGLVKFLARLDGGEGGRTRDCYTLTVAGREWMQRSDASPLADGPKEGA